MNIAIIKTCIDRIYYVFFTAIKDGEVIGIAQIVHPHTTTPCIQGAFVKRSQRRKGVWKALYNARIEWIKDNCKFNKSVHLFVHDKNKMIDTYKKLGFEYTGEEYEQDSSKKWMIKHL